MNMFLNAKFVFIRLALTKGRCKIFVKCSWCKKHLGEKEPLSDFSITHGICPECMKAIKNEAEDFFRKIKEASGRNNGE